MRLTVLPGEYAVCRLDGDEPLPDWFLGGEFQVAVRTRAELSLVCQLAEVPANIIHEPGWRIIAVIGPLEFSQVGILAKMLAPLSDSGVSVFVVSTYDTDYILVKDDQLNTARDTLIECGYEFVDPKIQSG